MSDRIMVSTDWMNECAAKCRELQSALISAKGRLYEVNTGDEAGGDLKHSLSGRLRATGRRFSSRDVAEGISVLQSALDTLADDTDDLMRQLGSAVSMFENAEASIGRMVTGADTHKGRAELVRTQVLRFYESWQNTITPYERWMEEIRQRREEREQKRRERINRQKVFDSEGAYGGNQGAPYADKDHYDDYREIIRRNTGRELTEKELKKYLKRLNSEGCGYVYMTNTIFKVYEGRMDDFERDFGFPMYKNGDLNYNDLLVDIYSSTDNYLPDENGGYTYNNSEDYDGFFSDGAKKWYDPVKDDSGRGITMGELENRAQKYLEEHGLQATVTQYDNSTPDHCITGVDDYNRKIQSGELTEGQVHVFVGNPFYIYDSNGKQIKYDGGHFMTITGTENGRYKVSSWGDTYYIDPNDGHGFIYYQNMVIQ